MTDSPAFQTMWQTRDGRTITIRGSEADDLDAVSSMMGEPAVVDGTLQTPFTSLLQRESWVERWRGTDDVMLVAEVDGAVVGNAGLHPNKRPRTQHAAHLGMSVRTDMHGQGVGTALVSALCQMADDWLQLRRIELTVFTDNEPALALYQRAGFEIEGTLREFAFRRGSYVDAHVMGRLRPST